MKKPTMKKTVTAIALGTLVTLFLAAPAFAREAAARHTAGRGHSHYDAHYYDSTAGAPSYGGGGYTYDGGGMSGDMGGVGR